MPKEKSSGGSTSEPARARGSLTPEGSWSPGFNYPSLTERVVLDLLRARRAARVSPAQLAEQIGRSKAAGAFPTILEGGWDSFTDYASWPLVPCRTSAEAIVKYGGTSPDDGHWEGGDFVSGRDHRTLETADPAAVAAFVSGLVGGIGAGVDGFRPPPRAIPDEVFFEGQGRRRSPAADSGPLTLRIPEE